jgi:hypothetical protein
MLFDWGRWLTCEIGRGAIVGADLVLCVGLANAVAVLLVDLAQLLLQLALLLVEVEQILLDEGLHIHLHVVSSDGVGFALVHGKRWEISEDALCRLRLTHYSCFPLFLLSLPFPFFLLFKLLLFQFLLFQLITICLLLLLTVGSRSCFFYAAEPSRFGLLFLFFLRIVSFGKLLGGCGR